MADLTITATQVLRASSPDIQNVMAGATITAGQVVYLDSTAANVAKLAQADGTAAEATVKGIALHAATSGQPVQITTGPTVTLGAGAAMTVGEIYILSATAGGICPEADITTTGHYVSVIGVATSASVLKLNILNSGATIP